MAPVAQRAVNSRKRRTCSRLYVVQPARPGRLEHWFEQGTRKYLSCRPLRFEPGSPPSRPGLQTFSRDVSQRTFASWCRATSVAMSNGEKCFVHSIHACARQHAWTDATTYPGWCDNGSSSGDSGGIAVVVVWRTY